MATVACGFAKQHALAHYTLKQKDTRGLTVDADCATAADSNPNASKFESGGADR
jgi:hypothetical protein